jgi:methylglutaconyl-CoA hydratase
MGSILVEKDGAVLRVCLDRPEIHNAFNEEVISELCGIFSSIPDSTRVVVLSGSGKSFCAGADLQWMKKMVNYSLEENQRDSLALFNMIYALRTCPVPVIARVHGAAIGGGAGLVAACDMAFATERASFGFSEIRLGILPAVISPFVLEKIGSGACSRYFYTGERFKAGVAKNIGLIQEAVQDEKALDQVVFETVSSVLQGSGAAIAQCKRVLLEVSAQKLVQHRDTVVSAISRARVSPEGQEGMQAFLEKRVPEF